MLQAADIHCILQQFAAFDGTQITKAQTWILSWARLIQYTLWNSVS
jgi:hypothetical protein